MAPKAVDLILGWWLVAASRAQQLPQPSLSLHPSQGVSLGYPVTLRCHLPWLAAWVWLYQEEGWSYNKGKEKEENAAEFFFVSTLREHASRYWCQYRVSESAEVSVKSNPVELVLTDRSFPPPGISLHPKQCVEMGTNITIRCWNKDYWTTFLLHKDGLSAPIQRQEFSGGGTATFTLFGVTPADSGTYRCSYRPWRYAFMSSPLGDSVMLEVTPTAAPPGTEEQSRANVVIALVRGFVAALVFGLGVFFVIDARSLCAAHLIPRPTKFLNSPFFLIFFPVLCYPSSAAAVTSVFRKVAEKAITPVYNYPLSLSLIHCY